MNKIQEFEMWLGQMNNQLEKANKAGIPLIVQDMKKDKYPNGYLPKIEYWLDKVENGRTKEGRAHAKSKVMYFLKRQMEL
jgi:hypothetical protein